MARGRKRGGMGPGPPGRSQGPGSLEGPPALAWTSLPWLLDGVVPLLTARQLVMLQLVCREWRMAVGQNLKKVAPRRVGDPAALWRAAPNVIAVDLSALEGVSVSFVAALLELKALRDLALPVLCGVSLAPSGVTSSGLQKVKSQRPGESPAPRPACVGPWIF